MKNILPLIGLSFPLIGALLTVAPVDAAPPDWANHPENQWVKQGPRDGAKAPTFGWEGSGAFDPYSKRWIHQGGHDGIPQGFILFTCDLESGIWEQKFPDTSPPGVCCVDAGNTFDLANRRFVRFPGASLGHGYQWSRGVKLKNSAVWLYDSSANSWTNMRPAPYHRPKPGEWLGSLNASATYDPVHGLALSFGGQDNSGGTNNLHAYDAYANALYRFDAIEGPSRRDGSGLAYDAKNDCLVMFGSQYASDEKTWIYRYANKRWEGYDINPRPPGKKNGTYSSIPRMAFDSTNGVCLCVTWDTNTNEHQTWTFDAAQMKWAKMSPPAEPSPSMSRARNLVYLEEHNVFLLELGPKATNGKGVELWTYRFKKAPKDNRPPAPTGLELVTAPGKATLTWSAGPASVDKYRIYRTEAEKPWQTNYAKIGEVSATPFEDAGLASGKVYFYQVKAVTQDGVEGPPAFSVRTQPRAPLQPIVSVLAKDKVEVTWKPHPAQDIAGYNVYRGRVTVRTVKQGVPSAWKDNDPEYAEPVPVEVNDITDIQKLNERPLTGASFTDSVDLSKPGQDSGGYRFAVYAYIVRAINRLGTESGPSPYALTIPSAPRNVLNRERGKEAELKWDAGLEKSVSGYHVYKLEGTWKIVRVTREPVKETTFRHEGGGNATRYWIVTVDALGQEGEPSSPVWHNQSYRGFFKGDWHQ